MHYVYRLQSITDPTQTYIGSTNNLKRRLTEHNTGKSIHTNKHKPWTLSTYIAFSEEPKAEAFEQYLKSGSGRAFSAKYF